MFIGIFDKKEALMNIKNTFSRIHQKLTPSQSVVISFLLLILAGSLILYLPVSSQPGKQVSYLDALFTTTSAVCVTGLVTLTTAATWSLFGKLVILFLIQIGGLSLITIFTFFLVQAGRKVTLKDRLAVQSAFNDQGLNGMVKLVTLVIRGTLIVEGIGAAVLFLFFLSEKMDWHKALFYGVFHSVSAFCNAGFDLIGDQSLIPYSGNVLLNITIMVLIILGGIGFTVWRDIHFNVHSRLVLKSRKKMSLSLHSKLVLITTAILTVLGTLLIFLSEYSNPATIGNFSEGHKLLSSLFQSVTLRTAGFTFLPQDSLSHTSKMISCILMMIGGSPGGTAGGIKTVTVAVIICSVISTISGRKNITVFNRTIPFSTLQKALAVIVIMLFLWLSCTALLSITERNSAFEYTTMDLLYEVASALGTTGLTTGLTPHLSALGKFILMFCVFIGRLSPIVLLLSLANRSNEINSRIKYPSEDIMIG
jgi:trk system potassium uptake protein TrkH